MFNRLMTETAWEQRSITVFGKRHLEPRLTAWYGDPGATYQYSDVTHDPLPWTPLLTDLRGRLASVAQTRFNSVLLNLYRDGRDSNGWHADDERELGASPVIGSISLGETRRMRFRRRDGRATFALDLRSGDALVMRGDAQSQWQHCIPKTSRIVGPRINLTFRWVNVGVTPNMET
jgi:alkylated DNA repair dioxygenase AlkB